MRLEPETESRKLSPWPFVACFLLASVAYIAIWLAPASGHDWRDSFLPAARQWWRPFDYPYHNPPWAALLLWPLAILPERAGFVANGLVAILVTAWFVRRQEGSWLSVLVTLLSPPLIGTLIVGNIEWLSILGLLVGGAWSVPLLLTKPQTAGLAALLFFKRSGYDWRFWLPAGGVMAASFAIWGFWPVSIPPLPADFGTWNISIFPWGVPIGLICAWLAWKHDSLPWALLACPFLSPYLAFGSLLPATAAWSARRPRTVGLLVLAFWLPIGLFLLLRG